MDPHTEPEVRSLETIYAGFEGPVTVPEVRYVDP